MRVSDLSRQAGVPVATIKFYLRERLLPPGRPIGRNQADYDETHLRRLYLIRAFANIGQLDLSTVADLLAAIDNDRLALPGLYDVLSRLLLPPAQVPGANRVGRARADVDALIDATGWQVDPDAPGRARLTEVVATLRNLGCECGIDFFESYAEASERLVIEELDLLDPDGTRADRATAVASAILLEVALSAFRRMAQEHHLANSGVPAPPGDRSEPAK